MSEDMSMKNMEKILLALCEARRNELKAMSALWVTPTDKQKRRLNKLKTELEDFGKKLRQLQRIMAI